MRYDRLAPQIGSENARTAALGGEVLIAEKLPVWQLHICDWLALPVNLAAMEWPPAKARGVYAMTDQVFPEQLIMAALSKWSGLPPDAHEGDAKGIFLAVDPRQRDHDGVGP